MLETRIPLSNDLKELATLATALESFDETEAVIEFLKKTSLRKIGAKSGLLQYLDVSHRADHIMLGKFIIVVYGFSKLLHKRIRRLLESSTPKFFTHFRLPYVKFKFFYHR